MKEEYSSYYQKEFRNASRKEKDLKDYLIDLLRRLNQLTDEISKENFWSVLPRILGIDAKLNLLVELIKFEELPSEEIIRIIENDYQSYFKELCGYDLSMETRYSLVFNVA
jgi:replication fork clamp-binding protein CrfC